MRRPYSLLAILPILLFAACAFPSKSNASTTAVLRPNSDGNYKQFTPRPSGTIHYTEVNESLCNGNTNYNTASSVGTRDSYGISVTSVGMGDGAIISQIDIVPCLSRNETGTGSVTSNVFYRWNGVDSSDQGSFSPTTTTPIGFATSTFSGLGLFKTSTSILEIGAVLSSTSATTRGLRLSRIKTVLTYTLTAPVAPTALAANNVSNTENDLTWTNTATNTLGFKIYRSQDGGSFSQISTTTQTFFNDTSVTSGNTYSYEVSTYNSAGEAFSSIVYSTITYSGGSITSATTWQSIYVYVINGTGTVASNGILTVQAGTVVKFQTASSKLEIANGGALNAQGTSTSSIYFTSYKDDSVGGDPNMDGPSSGSAGNWNRIQLDTNASATFTYAITRYGARTGQPMGTVNIWNNGGSLTLNNTEVASGTLPTAVGVYNSSGTSTIAACNIHDYQNGLQIDNGLVTIASTAIHNNYLGIAQSGGTFSVTSSYSYTNSYEGIQLANTNFTIASNAIHGNTTYGVDGTGLGSVNFPNIWWGTWVAPGLSPNGTATSDSISSNATATPWHHELGYWAVRNFGLTWRNIDSIYTDELSAATFNWNSATAGMGIIPVASTTNSTLENSTISDWYDSSDSATTGKTVCGKTTAYDLAASTTDTIQFNEYCMDTYIGQFLGQSVVPEVKHAVVLHEMGHALGLGHSDPIQTDVMYSDWSKFKTDGFGPEDQSDYTFLWSTIKWATSKWWPRLHF